MDGFNTSDPRYRADSLVARNLAERGVLGVVLWLAGMAALIVLALRLGGGHLFPAAALVSALALAPVSPAFKATNEALLFLLPLARRCSGSPRHANRSPRAAERMSCDILHVLWSGEVGGTERHVAGPRGRGRPATACSPTGRASWLATARSATR